MAKAKVRLLEKDVIGKISAGEVVERPVSVLKELVENSIDAGSGSIEVDIEDAGQSLIRIADDGCGMSAEDLGLAWKRHATSKISSIEDLDKLATLGFRGEALSSIAAVSRMEITSADSSSGEAVLVYIEGSELQNTRPAARPKGTTVEVRNLFYNVPARKKFLKKESTELAMIMDTFGRFILSNPDIEFKLTHGGRVLMHASRDMAFRERVKLVLGGEVAGNMVDVDVDAGSYGITGCVSAPASTRKDKRSQVFFVNGRSVKSGVLNMALHDAYRSLLERGRYPSCVIFISIDPSSVDVNVHPTKLLVKFDDERALRAAVAGAVKRSFDKVREERRKDDKSLQGGMPVPGVSEGNNVSSDVAHIPEVQTVFEYEPSVQGAEPLTMPVLRNVEQSVDPREGAIFQVGGCYIVRIRDNSIFITDQHAAHERILYEYFSRVTKERGGDIQSLLFPVRMDLSAPEAVIMDKLSDKFKSLGFVIEHFGDNSYVIQGVPAILKDRNIKKVVTDILADLSSCDLDKIDPVETMIKYTSCRSAIKAGDELDAGEMVSLLDQLDKCELPFTCPHGRPTSTEITVDELEKRFRRK